MKEYYIGLSNIDIFSKLDLEEISKIGEWISWKTYEKETVILSYHDEPGGIFFIGSGSVKATAFTFSGKEIYYQKLGAGKTFGELSAIDGGRRTTSIICEADSVIGTMSGQKFREILETHPTVMLAIMNRLTEMIRFLCGRVYEYGALDVKGRIHTEIFRHARENSADGRGAEIKNMPTHEEIANKIITHREAVTKEFSRLTKQGLIKKEGRTLIVPDIQAISDLIVEEI